MMNHSRRLWLGLLLPMRLSSMWSVRNLPTAEHSFSAWFDFGTSWNKFAAGMNNGVFDPVAWASAKSAFKAVGGCR